MTSSGPSQACQLLTLDDAGEVFNQSWSDLSRAFIKLEVRQEYAEPDDPSYQSFLKGDLQSAASHLHTRISSQENLYVPLCQKGIEFIRLRVVKLPISKYLEYEFISYGISARFGERILIVNHNDLSTTLLHNPFFRDLLLFDKTSAYIHEYNQKGIQIGAWITTDLMDIDAITNVVNELRSIAYPLGIFANQSNISLDVDRKYL